MARQAVLEILNSSIGRYLSDVDIEKLNMSLWKGQIDFPRSLKLNVDAINQDFLYLSASDGLSSNGYSNQQVVEDWAINVNCDKSNYNYSPPNDGSSDTNNNFSNFNFDYFNRGKTPGSRSLLKNLRIVKGTIHKVQIDVPWAALASRPVVVRVSGVNIILAPVEKKNTPPPSAAKGPHNPQSAASAVSSGSGMGSMNNNNNNNGNTEDDQSVFSLGLMSNLGGSRHGERSLLSSSRHGGGTITSKSSRTQQEGFVNKIFRALPYSVQMNNEMLKMKQKKEEDSIRKKRRFVIERRDGNRKRNKKLSESMLRPPQKRGSLGWTTSVDNLEDYDNFGPSPQRNGTLLPQEGSSFYERLKVRILENLQLDISNVHIQFMRDDDASIKNDMRQFQFKRFLAGIVLDALSFDTTDEHGRRTFMDRIPSGEEDFLFKALRISGFGVYLEDRNEMGGENNSLGSSLIDDNVSLDSHATSSVGASLSPSLLRHDFIVEPLSFEAAYRQSDNSHSYTEYPKYLLFCQLPHLSMCLSRTQIDLVNDVIDAIVPTGSHPLYPEYKPACSVTSRTAKLWWRYAFRCIRRMKGRHLWVEFVESVKKRKQYIQLYKRYKFHTDCLWLDQLSPEEIEELHSIEDDRFFSVEGIVMWKEMAEKEVEKEKKENSGKDFSVLKKNKFLSPFQKVNRDQTGSNSNVEPTSCDYHTYALSLDEIQELEEQLDYISDQSELPRGSKLMEIEFSFGSLVLDLVSTRNSQPLAKLRLGTVETLFSISSGRENLFRLSVLSLQVEDTMTIQPIFPSIIRSVHTKTVDSAQSVDMMMNTSHGEGEISWPQAFTIEVTTSEEGNKKLEIFMVALEIVASSPFLVEIIDFFHFERLSSNLPSSPLEHILKKCFTWLSHSLFKVLSFGPPIHKGDEKQWDVNCEIDGPTLVLPDFFCDDNKSDVLVLDCGKYRFNSMLDPSKNVEEWFDKITKENTDSSDYMKEFWKLEITDVQCFLGRANVCDWVVDTKPEDKLAVKDLLPLIEPIETVVEIGKYGIEGSCVRTFHECDVQPIRISVSLQVLTKALKVLSSWSSIKKDVFGFYAPNIIRNLNSTGNEIYQSLAEIKSGQKSITLPSVRNNERDQMSASWSVKFHELSAVMDTGSGGSLEAHLLSLTSLASIENDSSSSNRFSLGQFWVVDRMDSRIDPKLLVHADLPPQVFSDQSYTYDFIVEEIRQFEEEEKETNICFLDISLLFSAISEDSNSTDNDGKAVSVNVTISGIHLNWHPSAVKYFKMISKQVFTAYYGDIGRSKNDVFYFHDSHEEDDASTVESVSTAPDMMEGGSLSKVLTSVMFPALHGMSNLISYSTPLDALSIRLGINAIEIRLYSIVEDREIFLFFMNKISAELDQHSDSALEAKLQIESFSVNNPSHGQFFEEYEQLLSMQPFSDEAGKKESFLTITYNKVVSSIDSNNSSKNLFVAKFGPTQAVFSTKQISAMQRYFLEEVNSQLVSEFLQYSGGIFVPLIKPSLDEKYFEIISSRLEIIIPQSIQSSKYLKVHVDETLFRHNVFPLPGGGKGVVSFKGLTIMDSNQMSLITNPVEISSHFTLPETNIDGNEEKPVKICVQTSKSEITLSKQHFFQIINTIHGDDDNLECILGCSASDTYERFDSFRSIEVEFGDKDARERIQLNCEPNRAEAKRIKFAVELKFDFISLFVSGVTNATTEKFLNVVSENTVINYASDPKSDEIEFKFTASTFNIRDLLKNKDEKGSPFLVLEIHDEELADSKPKISLHITKSKEGALSAELALHALEFIFLPDVIENVIHFFHSDIGQGSSPLSIWERKSNDDNHTENISDQDSKGSQGDSDGDLDLTESQENGQKDNFQTIPIELRSSFKTSLCRFIFLDNELSELTKFSSAYNKALSLHGEIEITSTLSYSKETGDILAGSLHCHGQKMEIFTTKTYELNDPIQILDSADISFVGYFSQTGKLIDMQINLVSLTDLFFSISTQNALLLASITSSVKDDIGRLQGVLQNKHKLSNCDTKDALSSEKGSTFFMEKFFGRKQGTNDFSTSLKASVTVPKVTILLSDNVNFPDQPLLKIATENFLIGGERTTKNVDFHVHVTNIFEYFNSRSIRWEPWFIEPWEISVRMKRKENDSIKTVGKYFTTFDIDSSPMYLSLTDELLKKMKNTLNAHASIYGVDRQEKIVVNNVDNEQKVLPYGIENRTDFPIHFTLGDKVNVQVCESGEAKYFHHDCVKFDGTGKKYLYGQDVSYPKTLQVYIGQTDLTDTSNVSPSIIIHHMDDVNIRRLHQMIDGQVVFSEIVDTGKSIVLCLRSQTTIYNCTKMAWGLSASSNDKKLELGVLGGLSHSDDDLDKKLTPFEWASVPSSFMDVNEGSKLHFHNRFDDNGDNSMYKDEKLDNENMYFCWGELELPSQSFLKQQGDSEFIVTDVCTKDINLACHAVIKVTLIDECPLIQIFIKPRAVIQNNLPVSVFIRTSSANTFSEINSFGLKEEDSTSALWTHRLDPYQDLHVLSSGDSISFSIRFADDPIIGPELVWNTHECIDIPLKYNEVLAKPVEFIHPESNSSSESCVYLVEQNVNNTINKEETKTKTRRMSLIPSTCIIDHTNQLLFSAGGSLNLDLSDSGLFLNTFGCKITGNKRITMLDDSNSIIEMMEDFNIVSGEKRCSIPFKASDISLCGGGVEATNLMWSDSTPSGYCAFRSADFFHMKSNMIHIIPEYLLLNNSGYNIQLSPTDTDREQATQVAKNDSSILMKNGIKLEIVIEFEQLGWVTEPILIKEMKTFVVGIKEKGYNKRIGSLAVDVSVGTRDARVIINIGPAKSERKLVTDKATWKLSNLWKEDFLKVRFQSKQVQIILSELTEVIGPPIQVALISFDEVDISFHRIYLFENNYETINEDEVSTQSLVQSLERSKFTVNIKDLQLQDTDPESSIPHVLTPESRNGNSVEVSMYFRGVPTSDSYHADMVNVNLWSHDGIATKVSLKTSDKFVYRLMDFMRQMIKASSEDYMKNSHSYQDTLDKYTYPKPEHAVKYRMIRISPLLFHINIEAEPDVEVKLPGTYKYHPTFDYLKHQLNFPLQLQLSFSEYSARNLQGRMHHVLEIARIMYYSRFKFNMAQTSSPTNDNTDNEKDDLTEEKFILRDLSQVASFIPGLNNKTAFSKIGVHTINEFQIEYNLMHQTDSRAVLKESGSGSIMYASSSQTALPPREPIENEKPSLLKNLGNSTRSIGDSTISLLNTTRAIGNSTRSLGKTRGFFSSFSIPKQK